MNYRAKLKNYWLISLEYLLYLFVFLLPWQTKLIIRPAETNFTEISLYLRELVLLISLALFFLGPRYLKQASQNSNESNKKYLIFWPLLLVWGLLTIASVFPASDRLLVLSRLILFGAGLGLVYLLKKYFVDARYRLTIIYVFLSSLWFQAILGIYQFLTQSAPVCKYLGLAAHNPISLGTSVVETLSGRWLRAYGGFDHPNIFGGVLVLGLLVAAYLFSQPDNYKGNRSASQSIKLAFSNRRAWLGSFLLIFYFSALTALFFTFSRSAWLALITGLLILLIYFLFSAYRRPVNEQAVRNSSANQGPLSRYLALLFFSAIFFLIMAAPFQELITTRLAVETRLEEKSIIERGTYLAQSLETIKYHVWLGVGSGNYTLALKDQALARGQTIAPIWNYQPVHNAFLLLFAESGLLVALAFSGLLLYLLIKKRHSGIRVALLLALIILMLFDHWLLSLPFGILLLFLVLGLI